MSKLKVLIVEDEPVIAENIAVYLDNNDFEVSGIAYDSEEALQQLKANVPDAVILDINLDSSKDGIEIAAHINQRHQLPFLFLTSYSDKDTLTRAKEVKPAGYIVKPFNEKTLLAALEIAISNHAAEKNHHLPLLNFEKINRQLDNPLTDREFEIAQQIYEGITNSQMAEKLFIAVNTVKTHVKNLFFKLEVSARLAAIARLRELMMK
jgi:DNA-binding NarL/FixJ family response regulator